MIKKLLLITLGFSIAAGGFWASQAQDPAPQNPSNVRTDPPTVAAQSTPADLSGTYAGTFNCEPLGLTGDTTLTINGNEFTLADGRTGRLVASTTKGYTAVALQLMPAATAGATAATTPQVVSLRAKKSGNRLTLSPASGAKMKCSFVTGKVARGKQTPAATGTEVSNPAAVPTESPMPSQSPSPIPSPTASPTPEPTPEPNPSPAPTTTPTPVPSPGEPTPSPTASPTPTPTPSPSPRA